MPTTETIKPAPPKPRRTNRPAPLTVIVTETGELTQERIIEAFLEGWKLFLQYRIEGKL